MKDFDLLSVLLFR